MLIGASNDGVASDGPDTGASDASVSGPTARPTCVAYLRGLAGSLDGSLAHFDS